MHRDDLVAQLRRAPTAPDKAEAVVSVQQAWEWAGGNPGVKATAEELKVALETLDQVCDEACDRCGFIQQHCRCTSAPPDLAVELPDPNAPCDLATLQGTLMNNKPLNVNQRSALYAMAAEMLECRQALSQACNDLAGQYRQYPNLQQRTECLAEVDALRKKGGAA